MRAYGATFTGAFMIALIYETKPEPGGPVTVSRQGDTAVVIDTAATPIATDTLVAPAAGTAVPSRTPLALPSDIEALRAQGMIVPVAGVQAKDLIDSFDDMRGATRRHNALDIMAPRNTPALAATEGTILALHNSVAGGLTIYMANRTKRFVLMYGHLDAYRPGLAVGQPVKRGEIIGFVGSTGNANPLAPHLHFQVLRNDDVDDWWKGTPLNPFLIYRQ